MITRIGRHSGQSEAEYIHDQNQRRTEDQLLHLTHQAHPLETFEQQRIVLAVIHFFSKHYHEPITIPDLSRPLGISLLHIETAFDLYKGKTAHQSLLEYRLNRLCDLIGSDPSQEIEQQISHCGLRSTPGSNESAFSETDERFVACFGIGLVEYHQQCSLATAARLKRQSGYDSPSDDERLGENPQAGKLQTRFHDHPRPVLVRSMADREP